MIEWGPSRPPKAFKLTPGEFPERAPRLRSLQFHV